MFGERLGEDILFNQENEILDRIRNVSPLRE